jgi:IS30 family transposase
VASRLTPRQKQLVVRLRRAGFTLKDAAREAGCSLSTAFMLGEQAPKGARAPEGWSPRPGRLTLSDREEIMIGLSRCETFSAIAARIDKAVSTVSREVASNGGRDDYRPSVAHQLAFVRARRPKASKLATCPHLLATVTEWLENLWSPDEVAHRLRREFPDDPMMWVSHETIYHSIYVQGRGELRRELHRCLRSGRAQRRPRGRPDSRGKIADMVMISDRPAEVADRAVPGHWEGDLIMGKNGLSAVGTLVERSTRYTMLLHLAGGRGGAVEVDEAMRKTISTLPAELFRTITWDQGKELSRHASFTIDTGIQVYFCDPHSPWQRGSNENTNGLLRQYMPKGTDLSLLSEADLVEIARSLNNRPRKTLDYLKPSEKLAELLALTG